MVRKVVRNYCREKGRPEAFVFWEVREIAECLISRKGFALH